MVANGQRRDRNVHHDWCGLGHRAIILASMDSNACRQHWTIYTIRLFKVQLHSLQEKPARGHSTLFHVHRSLGLNTVTAYQRAKVSALKIVNLGMGNHVASQASSRGQKDEIASVQVDLEPPRSQFPLASSIPVPPQTQI